MAYSKLNPKTKERDFFGTPGAFAISTVLPVVVLLLHSCCNEDYLMSGFHFDLTRIADFFRSNFTGDALYSVALNKEAWKNYSRWFFGLVLADQLMNSKMYPRVKCLEGVELRDGRKLKYSINGLSMSATLVMLLIGRFYQTNGEMPELQYLYHNLLSIMTVSMIFSFGLASFVYLCSFLPLLSPNGAGTRERILAVGGNSGNPVFDWFIGRELNPRILSWDIKLFCELKPGMFLWLLVNLSCLHQQYLKGGVTNSMIYVNAVQAFYIFDGLLNEEGCLTMMDLTTDGFGFMLAFGDLTWVPFTYSLQARYLTLNPVSLSSSSMAGVVTLFGVGYYIFQGSNSQKSQFRQGKLPQLKSIPTKRGTKLLCDGWWGMSQHINYFGDWLMAWSWCLPTGFNAVLTYFYVVYFAVLLLHRQTRDEHKCSTKYGEAWAEYEKKVPYKIIPYVY